MNYLSTEEVREKRLVICPLVENKPIQVVKDEYFIPTKKEIKREFAFYKRLERKFFVWLFKLGVYDGRPKL